MKLFLSILIIILGMSSCNDTPYNPNIPDGYFNFSIEPNTTFYYELNTVGGWMYLMPPALTQSRGIIVFRYSQDEFKAYERQSPNEPNYCGEYSRLIVDFPFVIDTCLDVKYNILNGSIVTEGYQGYPLIQYHTQYDGTELRIYN